MSERTTFYDGPREREEEGLAKEETTQRWYFTFGVGQRNAGSYFVVENATYSEARDRMLATFGREWAFQYNEDQWHRDGVSQADRYGLSEIR